MLYLNEESEKACGLKRFIIEYLGAVKIIVAELLLRLFTYGFICLVCALFILCYSSVYPSCQSSP